MSMEPDLDKIKTELSQSLQADRKKFSDSGTYREAIDRIDQQITQLKKRG